MCSARADSSKVPLPNVWRLSASLAFVPQHGENLVLVTSLERAVRAWVELTPDRRVSARLTIGRTIMIDGIEARILAGAEIDTLARRIFFD